MAIITRQRLVCDTGWSVVTAIANAGFGFGYLLVIGNKWGSEGIGIFSLSATIYLIGSLIFNVGIQNAVLYEVAASGEDKKRAASFAYTALFSSLVLGLIGAVLGYIFAPWFETFFKKADMGEMVRLFALALPLFLVNKTCLGILNAHRRMGLLAFVNIIRGATILIYLICVVIFEAGLVSIPYGFILAESLIVILLLFSCVRTHRFNLPSFRRAGQLVSFGWKAALSGVIGDVNVRLDILVIGYFYDESVVGVYTVASSIAKGLWLITSAFQKVTNPLIVQLYSLEEKDKLYRTMDVLIRLGTSLFVIIGLVIAVYIKPLIGLCYPGKPEMLGSVMPLYFLLPGTIIFTGISMLGAAPSTSIGRPENAVKLISVVFGVNLVMNFVLVPYFAANGAATATTISLLAAVVFFTYLCREYLSFAVPWRKLFVLFFTICFLLVLLVKFEDVVLRPVILLVELVIMTAALIVFKMVHKSDWELINSIFKSFIKAV